MRSLEFLAAKLGKPVGYFVEDEEREQRSRERELDIGAASTLLNRSTASDALRKIEALLSDATRPEEVCRLRLMAATAHNFLTDGAAALRELTTAERLAMQLGKGELQRSITHQTAIALRNIGELARARSLLTELLASIEKVGKGDSLARMKLLKDLGAVSWDMGEYEKAAAYYESALQWANEIGDVAGLISIYNGLAYARRALGDLEGATTYLQRALAACQISNDLTHTAILHNALAVIAGERGHIETAYRHVDRAIELARVAGPEAYVAHYLNTKAECALKAGRAGDAALIAQEALGIADRTANGRAAAGSLVVLGEVERRADSLGEAVRRLEEAAGKYRDLGAKQELGDVLMRLSGVTRDQGDAERAHRYAEQAYQATKSASGLMGR
jgi:tetratricopeptide (TPR) repeat protein